MHNRKISNIQNQGRSENGHSNSNFERSYQKIESENIFFFVINLIIRVSSNPEEKIRRFPCVVWTGEGALSAYR